MGWRLVLSLPTCFFLAQSIVSFLYPLGHVLQPTSLHPSIQKCTRDCLISHHVMFKLHNYFYSYHRVRCLEAASNLFRWHWRRGKAISGPGIVLVTSMVPDVCLGAPMRSDFGDTKNKVQPSIPHQDRGYLLTKIVTRPLGWRNMAEGV